ncbi:MAG: chemotaxis protein CheW [Massilia sp.]|nr:chemotaxis protein CheW [Massilia sp.]
MAPADIGTGTGAAPRLDAAGRRARLRQYQIQLLERMQAARAGGAASVQQLGVLVGSARTLIALTEAGEIAPLTTLTRVPLTQPWYLGLANIRGNLVGVIDLARYLGEGASAPGPDSRLVTFAGALGFNCALLVARVYGLRDAQGMVAAGALLVDAEGCDWRALDLAALVREERFLHVGM